MALRTRRLDDEDDDNELCYRAFQDAVRDMDGEDLFPLAVDSIFAVATPTPR